MDNLKSIRSNPNFKRLFSFDENIVVSITETNEPIPKEKSKSIKNIVNKNTDVIKEDPFFFS